MTDLAVGRALVTGATGMLGSYIVDRLGQAGVSVRALVRDPDRAAWLGASGAELCLGSLEDREAMETAAEGCDVVFHAAAAIGAGGDWDDFHRGNVVGTDHVIGAAERAGARLVHVSSTAVFGRERYHDVPTHEALPLPELPDHDHYGRTKQLAEARVLEAHSTGRVWTTVVRPPVMYGLRDRQFAPRIGPVIDRGFFPLIGGGRSTLALVHAGSVADGAILAGRSSVAGGRVYHLTDDVPVAVALLVRSAARGLDRRVRAPSVPHVVGRAGFAALAAALRVSGRGDLARHAGGTLEMLTRSNPFCSQRARSELGWSPDFDAASAIVEAFHWWKDPTWT